MCIYIYTYIFMAPLPKSEVLVLATGDPAAQLSRHKVDGQGLDPSEKVLV